MSDEEYEELFGPEEDYPEEKDYPEYEGEGYSEEEEQREEEEEMEKLVGEVRKKKGDFEFEFEKRGEKEPEEPEFEEEEPDFEEEEDIAEVEEDDELLGVAEELKKEIIERRLMKKARLEAKKEAKKKKGEWVKIKEEEVVEKKVPVFTEQKKLSKIFDIPEFEKKLVIEKVEKMVRKADIEKEKKELEEKPKSLPVIPPKRPVKPIGDVVLPPRRVEYSPKKINLENPYKPEYPLGAFVSFDKLRTFARTIEVLGKITAFTPEMIEVTSKSKKYKLTHADDLEYVKESKKNYPIDSIVKFKVIEQKQKVVTIEGVVISFAEHDLKIVSKGEEYFVRYDDKTLKKIAYVEKPKPKYQKERVQVDDFLNSGVPDKLRQSVVKSYIEVLKILKKLELPPRVFDNVDYDILSNVPVSWDDYYAHNFRMWNYSRYEPSIKGSINMEELRKQAEHELRNEYDQDQLIARVFDMIPGGLTLETTNKDILQALREKKEISKLDGRMITVLEKSLFAQTTEIKGKDLGVFLTNAINTYIKLFKPTLEEYMRIMVENFVLKEFDKIPVTDTDRLLFETHIMKDLTDSYEKLVDRYNKEAEKAEKIEKEKKEAEEQDVAFLASYYKKMEREVEKFEQIVYAQYSSSVNKYLENVLLPSLFLDGKLSAKAKFFREKIINDSFPFSSLNGATLAHYFPEFSMNIRLSQDDWDDGMKIINKLLDYEKRRVASVYLSITDVTFRILTQPVSHEEVFLASKIDSYLVNPVKQCIKDSNSGKRPRLVNGKYQKIKNTDFLELEEIPEDDLVICYSDDKFTCHSVREILRAIIENKTINPYTGKPFPEQFINSMKERYSAQLKDPSFRVPLETEIVDPPKEIPVIGVTVHDREFIAGKIITLQLPDGRVIRSFVGSLPRHIKSEEVKGIVMKKKKFAGWYGKELTYKDFIMPEEGKVVKKTGPQKRKVSKNYKAIEIKKIALVGNAFTKFLASTNKIEIDTTDPEVGKRTIKIQKDVDDNTNVVVFAVDMRGSVDIKELREYKNKVKNKSVFVIGLYGDKATAAYNEIVYNKMTKAIPDLKGPFPCSGESNEDIRETLVEIIAEAENLDVQKTG